YTRRDLSALDSRIHPGELLAVFTGRQQSIAIGPNTTTGSFIVTRKNRFERRLQFFRMTIVGQRRPFLRREKVIVDRDDVPERCIDRIEFALFALVRKA